jgi:hypothetical protein
VLAVLLGKRLPADLRAYLITTSLLVLMYVSFYARYSVWSGDSAWGDRYVASVAQLVGFISVPMLLRFRVELSPFVRAYGISLIAVSAAIQLASLAFWLPLERYQMTTLGHPTCVVCLRFKNIVAFSLGKMDQWGLTNSDMMTDPWDYVHMTAWNFLPFMLRRIGIVQNRVVRLVFVAWGATLAALAWTLWRLKHALMSREQASRP